MRFKGSLLLLLLSLAVIASYFPSTTSLETKLAFAFEENSGERIRQTPAQSLDEMLLFFPLKYPHGNWRRVARPEVLRRACRSATAVAFCSRQDGRIWRKELETAKQRAKETKKR